ncbi:MAG TPA: phosphoglycerate mutase family protein [Steroidobacteraceae bacterium]|jgi:phosphohistidine phosphatase SixA|nr:phosphoglycerate mutase family protein [Steroidobacteraceae bacterium]
MEAPGITRHRRPFYAPLWVTLLAVLVAGGLAFAVHRSATTTVVVLVPSGEPAPGTIEDPPISAEGEQRAQRLARMFGEGGIGRVDGVYVSGERRAQQTAAPLLDLLHLTPVAYGPKDAAATAAQLLRAHAGGAVLVIGDGAALQQFLAELAGPQTRAVARDEPDFLYIVSVPTFGRAHVLRLKL